jgi:hypothetical protein
MASSIRLHNGKPVAGQIFPTEFQFPRPGRPSFCESTEEFRPPKKGEYYLSGAEVVGYLAPNDLRISFWIARAVKGKMITTTTFVRES